jgi:hypothetical protein
MMETTEKTIYKYLVERDNKIVTIKLPPGSRIIHGDYQKSNGSLWIWAEIPKGTVLVEDPKSMPEHTFFPPRPKMIPDPKLTEPDRKSVV